MGIQINQDIDKYLSRLTHAGMKDFVKELLTASDTREKQLLRKIQGKPTKNDLADLDEEMHGKPKTPEVEDTDDAFDLNTEGDEEEETDAAPKKRKK